MRGQAEKVCADGSGCNRNRNGDLDRNRWQRCNFRSLVVRPTDLQYKLATYSDRDSDLTSHMVALTSPPSTANTSAEAAPTREATSPCGEASSALDTHEGRTRGSGGDEEGSGGERSGEGKTGKWLALVLSFTLPPSCYATMLVCMYV